MEPMSACTCDCGCETSGLLRSDCDARCSCSSCHHQSVPDEGQGEATERVELRVEGMTCASCVSIIESFVGDLPGVRSVRVNLLSARAVVVFDPARVPFEDVEAAFSDVGFDAGRIVKEEAGQVRLTISGMTCASCANTIETLLKAVSGVK